MKNSVLSPQRLNAPVTKVTVQSLWKDGIVSSLLIIFNDKFYLEEIPSYFQNLSHMLFPKYVLESLVQAKTKELP